MWSICISLLLPFVIFCFVTSFRDFVFDFVVAIKQCAMNDLVNIDHIASIGMFLLCPDS